MSILGKQAKDKISGFEGVITGHVHYLTGCAQCLLMPKVAKDGSIRAAEWFDEQRLEIKSAKPVKFDNSKTPGFDKQAPKR